MSKNTVISIRGQGQTADAKYAVDSTPQGATHLASGPHTSGRKSVPKWQLGLLGLAVVISIALIAVGAIIPKIVESTIKTTVQNTVLLDVQEMKAAGQNKFYNSSSPMDFFLYSCTNLYAVLTDPNGATRPNFKEVGPFNFTRYQSKYDVVYNADRTTVSYKQLTTFQVADAATAALLNTPIIGPNPLHFGMGQQIMQMGMKAKTGKVTSLFPKNLLSDQQTHVGALAGLLLPLVFNVFTDPSDVLLTGMRAQSMMFYLGAARKMSDAAGGWPAVKEAWARGTPLLSAVPIPIYAALFEGFELNPTGVAWAPSPLLPGNLTSANLVGVASKVLDYEEFETSLAAPQGFAKWAAILTELQKLQKEEKELQKEEKDKRLQWLAAQTTAMINALGLTDAGADPADFGRIITWIISLVSPVMPSGAANSGAANPFYSAYERGCMAGIGGQVQVVSATGSNTTKATYANSADFEPKSWEDLGALQFGSGFMIGLMNQTAFLETGAGKSFRDLTPGAITDFKLPMNFQDRATATWGGMEPPEFVSGLRYYVDHCVLPPGVDAADTRPLWDLKRNPLANPHLLFVKDDTNPTQRTTLLPLTIAQSKKLMASLTNPAATGGLFTALNVMLMNYTAGYQGTLTRAADNAADPTNPDSVNMAMFLAKDDAIANGYDYASSVLAAVAFSPILVDSGVTITNFFAVYTYIASYLFNELAGPLSLLDPATGLAPQNTGLFTQRTAREMLFGYTSRFGDKFMVPGIAGVETDWSLHSARIAEDRLKKQGKDIVQYTGKGDFERIGQFVKYAGVSEYQSYCDLFDPTRINNDTCATAAVRAVYDEDLYASPLSISGTGDGMNQGPLREGDDKIVPVYTLYVDEARRPLPLVYNMTHSTVRDIEMRRYRVGQEPLVGDNYYRNKTQLRFDDDKQVPNGFTSVQSVTGGIPLLLGLPRFGPMVDATFDAGVTCSGADDVPRRCQDTYVDADHGTWIDVEPITGMTMYGRKRLQANFRTSKHELFTNLLDASMQGINYHYNNMFKSASWASNPNMILPYYWADLHDMLKDKDVKDFNDAKDAMAAGRNMGKIVHIAGITVGAVGVFASVGALIFLMARK